MADLRRIMAVEDDEDIRVLMDVALQAVSGFELASCSSGEEALEKIAEFSPDLLILDAVMPNMDGVQTLRAIRSMVGLPEIPAVFMTAKTHPAERERFMNEGAIDVLPKPFDPMTLGQALQDIWDSRTGSMKGAGA